MHEKLIYDGESHVSIASVSHDAYERTIVINGLSKSYAMTGWRLGYCGATEKIAKLMTNIQSHMTSNVCSITQYAAVEDSQNKQPTQNEQVDTFITKGVNALAVNAVDRTAAGPIIEKAKAKDLPIVFLNREPEEADMQSYDKVWYVGAKAEQSGNSIRRNYCRLL